MLVGRQVEQEQLLHHVADEQRQGVPLALVVGEAGIGKTALLRAVTEQRRAEAPVLVTRCRATTRTTAFAPWAELLAETRSELGFDPTALEQRLAGVHREASDLLSFAEGADPARQQLFNEIVTYLERIEAAQPLTVVIEDLHLADPASLALFDFFLDRLADQPVTVIASVRAEHLPDVPSLQLWIDHPDSLTLRLHALEPAALHELLGADSDPVVRSAAIERSGGNPLFALQLQELFRDQGISATVPHSVQSVVTRRLELLDSDVRPVLEAAAVCGIDFGVGALAEVAERSHDRVLDALENGRARKLVKDQDFVHALVRDALYAAQDPARRRELHHRAATVLIGRHDGGAVVPAGAIAHHLDRAGGLGRDRLGEFILLAGDEAERAHGYEDAASWYERLAELSGDDRAPHPEGCFDAQIRQAVALQRAGLQADADEVFTAAAGLARRLGGGQRLVRVAAERVGPLFDVDESVLALLDEAQSVVDVHSSAEEQIILLARRAHATYFLDVDEADRLAREAEMLARDLDDAAVLLLTLDVRRYTAWRPDGADELDALGREMIELSRREGDVEYRCRGYRALLFSSQIRGDQEQHRRHLSGYEHLADEIGQPVQDAFVEQFKASSALFHGDFDEAAALIASSSQTAQRSGSSIGVQGAVGQQLLLAWERGDVTAASLDAAGQADRNPLVRAWRFALLAAACAPGDEDEIRAEWQVLRGRGLGHLPVDYLWLGVMSIAAEIVCFLDDRESATELYSLLEPHRERFASLSHAVQLGSVALPLGRLSSLLGEVDRAEAELSAATAAHARLGARPWQCRSRLALADHFIANGDAARARVELHETRRIADSIAMVPMVGLVDARLVALDPIPTFLPRGLTEREVEVLRLVAGGRTNKELAAELFISIKTVERHLANIYTKCELRGRAEAVSFAHQHKLVD